MRNRWSFFARSSTSGRFGKIGPSLGALRLGHKTEELVRAEAARAGVPIAEWVRELVELRVHGRKVVEREITLRLDAIDGRESSATETQHQR